MIGSKTVAFEKELEHWLNLLGGLGAAKAQAAILLED